MQTKPLKSGSSNAFVSFKETKSKLNMQIYVPHLFDMSYRDIIDTV